MERGVIIGIDLSEDYAQISYIDESKNVVSVSVSENKEPYMIPTVMFYNTDLKEWSIGVEAVNKSGVENGVLIEDIFGAIQNSRYVSVSNEQFAKEEIMEKYFAGLFGIVRNYCRAGVEKAVISIENTGESLMEAISKAMERLGASPDDYRIISHAEGFIYYTLNQASEIWVNRVIMVDLSKKRCIYRRLFATKGRKPLIAEVTGGDISDVVNMGMLGSEEGRVKADDALCAFMSGELAGSAVSGIFLLGKGFDTNWFPRTVNAIRGNRRIFKGYNMISKGAGYAAREIYVADTLSDYVFSCPGRIQVNVYLEVERNEHEQRIQLAKAGDNWYQAGASVQCIINRTDVMKLIIQSPVTRESRNVFIDLSALPKRPDKTTRIDISLAFIDDGRFAVNVKDMGFGEFFEASDIEIRETVDLNKLR